MQIPRLICANNLLVGKHCFVFIDSLEETEACQTPLITWIVDVKSTWVWLEYHIRKPIRSPVNYEVIFVIGDAVLSLHPRK